MCWKDEGQRFLPAPSPGSDFASRARSPLKLKILLLSGSLFLIAAEPVLAANPPASGLASWYGEEHRGRLMANGRRFNPDKCTAASWFYPLGSRVRVTLNAPAQPSRSVLVTITDRGPARELVRDGRIIDLAHGAFKRIARPSTGLVTVTVALIE
jgi:rare lipoprotein A